MCLLLFLGKKMCFPISCESWSWGGGEDICSLECIRQNVAFCSDLGISGVLLCATLEGVQLFKLGCVNIPTISPLTPQLCKKQIFVHIAVNIHSQKRKSKQEKYNSHIRKLSTYLVIAAGMKMAESNKNPFYHLVQFVRLEKWD